METYHVTIGRPKGYVVSNTQHFKVQHNYETQRTAVSNPDVGQAIFGDQDHTVFGEGEAMQAVVDFIHDSMYG